MLGVWELHWCQSKGQQQQWKCRWQELVKVRNVVGMVSSCPAKGLGVNGDCDDDGDGGGGTFKMSSLKMR